MAASRTKDIAVYYSVLLCLHILCCFLQLCTALNFTCTASQDGNITTYRILDGSGALNAKASNCEFSWTNASKHVLAHHIGKNDLVMSNSIDTLVTRKCLGDVVLTRNCLSEGTEYIVNCSISCSVNAFVHGDKGNPPYWIAAVVVPVLLLALAMFLCYKFKDEILRKCGCGQVGGLYTSVKISADPKAADVEAGNK